MKHIKSYNIFENNDTKFIYHGSSQKFKKFNLDNLSKTSSQYTYGVGIYASDNKDYVKEYGKYIYTIDISDKLIMDFGKASGKHKIISTEVKNKLKNKLPFDIENITVWNLYTKIYEMFYDKMTIKERFNYGWFNSYKKASKLLLENGIDGLKYELEYDSNISVDYGNKGHGYVLFDDDLDIVKIEEYES